MTMRRVQLSRAKGWRKPENAVNIARPGRYGNPFRIGVPTPLHWRQGEETLRGEITAENAAEAVAYYRDWMNRAVEVDAVPIRPYLPGLYGHDLACWCKPDQPCHADVILEMLGQQRSSGSSSIGDSDA